MPADNALRGVHDLFVEMRRAAARAVRVQRRLDESLRVDGVPQQVAGRVTMALPLSMRAGVAPGTVIVR